MGRGKGADSELATSERVRSTWDAVTECACRDTESLSDSVSKAGTLPAPPPPPPAALLTLLEARQLIQWDEKSKNVPSTSQNSK